MTIKKSKPVTSVKKEAAAVKSVKVIKPAVPKVTKTIKTSVETTKKDNPKLTTKINKKPSTPVIKPSMKQAQTSPNIDNEYFQYLKISAGAR